MYFELKNICKPIEDDIALYEGFVRDSLGCEGELMQKMIDYVLSSQGKGIRAILVLLSAKLNDEGCLDRERMISAAMMIEMIHTATLIHDDVVDGADVRRSQPSVNAVWDARSAVLIGDYILAKALSIGLSKSGTEIVTNIAKTMGELCQGELLQSEQSEKLTMTRSIYNEIIHCKSASLICSSAVCGAIAANSSKESILAMESYGYNLGMAFQIKDDLLDYTGSNGDKKEYIDLAERKITLPLLTVLEKSSPEQCNAIINQLRSGENISQIADMVKSQGGIDMAVDVMNQYIQKAKGSLNIYPDSTLKLSLTQLCDFVVQRVK